MSEQALPAEEESLPSGLRLKLITIALILAPLLQVFDTSIVSIALKQMQGSLSATQDQIAWVLTSYLIALAVMTPVWGALGGIFGRKPLLLVATAGFTIFSLFAGASSTLEEILVHRFAQGIFGAAMIPLALSSLFSVYRREEFGMAMGWWSVGVMFGPVFGPTLGAYISEYFSWRWAFYLNLPLGCFAFIMIALLVPRPGIRTKRRFNYYGFVLLAIAVGTLQFILDRGERLEWFASPLIISLGLISAAAFWMFAVHSLTSTNPFFDPIIFRDRNFVSGIALRILFGALLFGSLVLLPPFVQNQGGYSLIDSGWIMAPRGAGAMFSALFIGYILKHVDPRKVIGFGMFLTAWTMWEMSNFTQDMDFTELIVINFIQGVSFNCFVVPVNTVAFSTLSADKRDEGTSFFSLLNNIGRSIGIALLAGYLVRLSQGTRAQLSEHVTPYADAFRHGTVPELWDLNTQQGLIALNRVMAQQAELIAYIADFRLLAIIIVASIPIVFFMQNPRTTAAAA